MQQQRGVKLTWKAPTITKYKKALRHRREEEADYKEEDELADNDDDINKSDKVDNNHTHLCANY